MRQVVTAIVNGFNPTPCLRCTCGAHGDLSARMHRHHDGSTSVSCLACGATLIADITADIASTDPDHNEDAETCIPAGKRDIAPATFRHSRRSKEGVTSNEQR